ADAPLLALLLGAALATKLLAVYAAASLVPLAAYSLARSVKGKPLAIAFARATVVLVAVGGLPYLYAWAVAGNPVLPFLNLVFASPYSPAYNLQDTRWMGHLGPGFLFDATFRSNAFGESQPG